MANISNPSDPPLPSLPLAQLPPTSTTPSSCPDSRTGVDMASVKMSMNPFYEIGVEEALRLCEASTASEVVASTVGPAQAANMLRTALAMGADCAVHVLQDPDPARPLLPLSVAKILRALALQENPDLLILVKQVKSPIEAPRDSSPRTFLSIPEFSTNPLSQMAD
ncbi:electron transfer flavoprotein subunit beta, mitochondrial-like [Triticum dicoccoides]|uniref:electron transfer flavoprotein subunit beta, mitochondrial-like n=1 Tax=Triticum dicoccoides TaxID=85692 RepID=UPI001890D54D|nr:electron transfer flavoprotein subunit beta, mitochondrial-like [Triticum dicoccoides]